MQKKIIYICDVCKKQIKHDKWIMRYEKIFCSANCLDKLESQK